MKGRLFIVSTPIGNLEDMTLRAKRVLGEVDLVAAEDTRRTGILLAHLGLKRPMVSYHDFNKEKRARELISRLLGGRMWPWSRTRVLRGSPIQPITWW
ncbi:MAG TPA: hypothetical protein EYP61_09580 [Candidatus Latescibacteria bacterium]|nr:hypothetical protein [Candidatus Latescibacterota bacterium]